MNIQELSIADLHFAEYNPRTINKEEFDGLKASLKKYGQVENIIVNKDMTIISGHQRTRAWQELGNKTIMGFVLDLTKREEKKLNVLMNSQAISGKYDYTLLSEILEELKLDDDYTELRLDVLEPLDLSEQDLDYSDKNKEIDVDGLDATSTITFKFDYQTYLEIIARLNNAKEKLGCDTNEEALIKLLNGYD